MQDEIFALVAGQEMSQLVQKYGIMELVKKLQNVATRCAEQFDIVYGILVSACFVIC